MDKDQYADAAANIFTEIADIADKGMRLMGNNPEHTEHHGTVALQALAFFLGILGSERDTCAHLHITHSVLQAIATKENLFDEAIELHQLAQIGKAHTSPSNN